MAANLLLRAGHDVTVLEKARGALDARGAGIVTHRALVAGLTRCGLAAEATLGVTIHKRVTLGGAGAQQHAVLGEMTMTQVLTSWGRIYQLLLAPLPAGVYRQGVTVERVGQDETSVQVHALSGDKRCVWRADLAIASDGIRSVVRQQLFPQAQPDYAGYVAWRGVCEESRLSQPTLDIVFEAFGFCLPPGEQMIGYPVAGPGQRTGVGERAYNFVWYRPAPLGLALNGLLTDDSGVLHPQGIAPNEVSAANVAVMRTSAKRLLAGPFAEIIEKTSQPFLQPIYDLSSDALAQGRVALMGDAGFVARPHVGMGVTKAMQDAQTLTDAITEYGAGPQALSAYAQRRLTAGQLVVARGRRLGAYMQASAVHTGEPIARDTNSVMRETAVDPELVPA